MPDCTIILHRHSGLSRLCRPTSFAADQIKPMLEGRMTNGNALHILHDRIPSHPMNAELKDNFEENIKTKRVIRIWKELDRRWKEGAKKAISKADKGEDNILLTRDFCPDAELILETNRERPGTIRNHLSFYPFEAAVEFTRYKIQLELSKERARMQDLRGSVEHLMEAHNAMASCNVLRDAELPNQIKRLGVDVVVLRPLTHSYLAGIEEFDLPIAVDRFTVKGLAELFSDAGIELSFMEEEVPPTYGETAIKAICSGGIDRELHKELTLKDIAFHTVMGKLDGWDDLGMWAAGYAIVEKDYESIRQHVFG